MTANWNRAALQELSANVLAKAGIPVVPEVQRQIEEQLAEKIFPKSATVDSGQVSQIFSQLVAGEFQNTIQQQLESLFKKASLAAIAELGLPETPAQIKPVASEEMLAGLSETPESGEELSDTTTSRISSESSAPTSTSPYPSTIPQEGQAPGGMPTTPAGKPGQQPPQRVKRPTRQPTSQATGQPQPDDQPAAESPATTGAAPTDEQTPVTEEPAEDEGPGEEETVEQHKERSIANALAAEKRRRTSRGQADMSGQQQAAHAYGLNMVANEGAKIGDKLKGDIKSGKFTSFYICLILAVVKDLGEAVAVAYFDPGLTGDILSIFIGGLLTALLLGEGTYFRKWLIKKFFGKVIVAFIVGLIPGVNVVFPEYTIAVLLMGWDNRKAILDLKHQLADLQQQMGQLKRMAASGPRGLAKARTSLQAVRQVADA